MIIGVLKENKAEENRVSLSPGGVEFMRQNGHSVLVEKNAGKASGFEDALYEKAGAEIVTPAKAIFEKASLEVALSYLLLMMLMKLNRAINSTDVKKLMFQIGASCEPGTSGV